MDEMKMSYAALFYVSSKSKTWNDILTIDFFGQNTGKARIITQTWNTQTTKLTKAQLTVVATPSSDRNLFDLFFNGVKRAHFGWDIGNTAPQTITADVTIDVVNGDNNLQANFSRLSVWTGEVSCAFTATLLLTFEVNEGSDPPPDPIEQEPWPWYWWIVALGVASIGVIGVTAVVMYSEERQMRLALRQSS